MKDKMSHQDERWNVQYWSYFPIDYREKSKVKTLKPKD